MSPLARVAQRDSVQTEEIVTGLHPSYSIDFGLLTRPLGKFRRGAISIDELRDAVAQCEFTPTQTLPDHDEDVVETVADLHRRLLESGAFDDWADNPADPQQLAAEVVIAVISTFSSRL